ncbi:hypothetical protein TNCV_1187561 [Trichonephila clavipes]|nr:hypothetical protein TNCV_1187561 [Trichonephila clavipes]
MIPSRTPYSCGVEVRRGVPAQVSSLDYGSKLRGGISVPKPDEIDNLIKEVVDLAREINLEVDSDHVQELLDSIPQSGTDK